MITDPAFYAVAVPAALLVGISKSGFASGIGALATPLLAMSVTVPQAAALVLPLLCLSDVMGLVTLRRHADWTVLSQLLPAGLVGIVLGWIASILVGVFADWRTELGAGSVLLAFGFSAAIGVFFGFYPARKAAQLKPIEALRYQ